ncbi:hypothetical protein BD626DRAFT_414104, partial [Schizophyllum amplum]
LDVHVPTPRDVDRIANALKQGTVCHGKDGTVIAIAAIADDEHYAPVPILLSPSCKKETGDELAKWLCEVVDVWEEHEYGKRLHGPIRTVASDGESSFRAARFKLCMTESLDTSEPLGELLSSLVGLNLQTGPRGLLGTCDPKHVIKRFATWLRSPTGLLVGKTTLMPGDFLRALARLPHMTEEKARHLMDPADKQNVPKAVSLIQALLEIEEKAEPPTNPAEAHRHSLVIFVAKTLGFFVRPFIDLNMDLAEQVRSHSTYTHLVSAMQLKHGLGFLTGALLADSLAIVKDEMHQIARLQLLDRKIRYFFILVGTDRLEVLFSNVRTQDHSRNFDALQLVQKLSIGAEVGAILERNPDIDPGHKRLNVSDTMGVDHVNPISVTGEVSVGSVNLRREWPGGGEDANDLLVQYLGPDARVDFKPIFKQNSGDFLRLNGKDYVGSRWTADDARSESTEVDKDSTHPSPSDPAPHSIALESSDSGSSVDLEDLPEGMDIEDYLTAEELDANDVSPPGSRQDRLFYNVDGRKFYKASYIAAKLTPEHARKVTLRPLRARGVTVEQSLRRGDSRALNLTDNDGSSQLKTGDLVATLVHIEKTVCLAVLEVRGMTMGSAKRSVDAIPIQDLTRTAADRVVTITGQILDLEAYSSEDAHSLEPLTSWRWSGEFVRFNSPRIHAAGPGTVIRILSPLIVPASSDITTTVPVVEDDQPLSDSGEPRTNHDTPADVHRPPALTVTWSFPSSDLDDALLDMWSSLTSDSKDIFSNLQLIPSLSNVELPYRDCSNDQAKFVVAAEDMPAHASVVKKPGSTVVPCKLCDAHIKINGMRRHQPFVNPCGWCGLEDCTTQIVSRKGKADTIISSCEYHYERMQYEAAKRFSPASPCTNVPLHYPLCTLSLSGQRRTIWKYNALFHFATEHIVRAEDGSDEFPQVPDEFLVATFITTQEATCMG